MPSGSDRSHFRQLSLFLCTVVMTCMQLGCHHAAHPTQTSQAPIPSKQTPDMVLGPAKSPLKFVVYGDIRFTESGGIRESRVSNTVARTAIVHAIAEEHPALVVISGDLVWRGANSGDWQIFDQGVKAITDAHIPILPVIGNHEYLSTSLLSRSRELGLKNYFERFPDIPNRPARPWYSVQYGNCYFLMLDSEDDDSAGSEQVAWMQQQLDSLPAGIAHVFVIIHRPPYTSATDGVHRSRASEREIARLLEQRQKAAARPEILMIAGHIHNYERYVRGGVQYIVSGGGGATPHPLSRGVQDLYKPLDPSENEYNYCRITVDHDNLKFEMLRLRDLGDTSKFDVRDSFTLTAPAQPANAAAPKVPAT